MPALHVQNSVVTAIIAVTTLLDQLLVESETIKPVQPTAKHASSIEPPLSRADFGGISDRINEALSGVSVAPGASGEDAAKEELKLRQFNVVEIAARDIFGKLVSSIPIDSPDFVKIWNFLDLLAILADADQSDPALLFWLVEELLDSQTIAGCRIVFDWLESRRERITPESTYKKWHLVLLRTCNELLRRLSKAEDTAFCGRVFIFLFQCFPLGDRSSVNLRGEYHVENVTTYESTASGDEAKMDIDPLPDSGKEGRASKPTTNGDGKKVDEPLSPDALYGLFWPLQETFSQPLKLFEPTHMQKFRQGIEETVKKFESFSTDEAPRSLSAPEDTNQGLKRKRGEEGDYDDVEIFNPKYLTSKDLFELEVSDLTFRRHVLVQALITLNFILSWTGEGKKKYDTIPLGNKNILYSGEFSEEDAKWAKKLKLRIADYMKKDTPGRIFHRMVDTVLSRDKNWVYWKMGGCHLITRDPVEPQLYAEAKSSAQRLATSKRLRPVPMGAVSLNFLQPPTDQNGSDAPKPYQLPELESFKSGIADDDFEIGMPSNDQTKARAVAGKASKSWRALRVAGKFKLAAFDRIDDPSNIGPIFEEHKDTDMDDGSDEAPADEDMPENRDPIVLAGPSAVGKSALVEKLLEAHKGVFSPVVRHTTREPVDGEVNGEDYHFVKAQEFNQLRDGDRLVEYSDEGDISYGTSTKAIEAITNNGKIPIIELGIDAAQFAKDMDFTARYILVKPPSPDALQARLEGSGRAGDAAKAVLDKLEEQLDESKTEQLFDTMIVNDDLDQSVQSIRDYLFAKTNGDANIEEE